MEPTREGGLQVSYFDRHRKTFVPDSTYRSRVLYDRDNLTRELTEQEFDAVIHRLLTPQPPHKPARRLTPPLPKR